MPHSRHDARQMIRGRSVTLIGLVMSLVLILPRPQTLIAQDEAAIEREERRDEDRGESDAEVEAFEDEAFEDELREIDERIDETSELKKSLQAQSANVQRRLELLGKVREAMSALSELRKSIEQAEERDDEAAVEQAERNLQSTEWKLEEAWALYELAEQTGDLLNLRREIRIDDQWEFVKPIERLIERQRRRRSLTENLFKAFREDDEPKVDELEAELDRLAEQHEGRVELLELRRALDWAIEEGEDEEAEELEAEIDAIRRELGIEEDDQGRAATRKVAPPPDALPVMLTEADLANASALSLVSDIVPKLRAACFECHDSSQAAGDLDLQRLVDTKPLVVHRGDWINVIEQIKNRSMPPADHDQPSESDRRVLAAWLTDAIENFDYDTVKQVGYEPARRLTHQEYNHTVRDLFGADLRPADRFPADMTASSGFENSANSLFLQPILMERYVGAARSIVDQVFPRDPGARLTNGIRILRPPAATGGLNLDPKDRPRYVLRRFASRAFRRPVRPEELDDLLSHCESLMRGGVEFDVALRDVVEAILVSPSFLMRTEEVRDRQHPFRVNDWELASRLSYFLWASMPDDELFDLAEKGMLSDPEMLDRQVTRMLADPRSDTIGSLFAAQWLGFTDLGRLHPDQIEHPWATDSLVEAMQRESAMGFAWLVRQDMPVESLVDHRSTFLNEELARFYGIDGVEGEEMRRVSLTDSPRGGVFGQASILAITSFPGRASPVLRGNWILSRLLGTPPPPPPPNVSEFDDEIGENDRLSQRQKLEMHRNHANCYACHSQIDPLGFSLSKFDWFGRYRPRNRGRVVDDRGQFPDGVEFAGIEGLQKVIIDERLDDLVGQLTRKMLAYALGRQLEYFDEATVRDIVEEVQRNDRRMQVLIRAIVRSDPFQMKQLPKPSAAPKSLTR